MIKLEYTYQTAPLFLEILTVKASVIVVLIKIHGNQNHYSNY